MKPTRIQLRELLRLVDATAPDEIDCDEFLARVGRYLETLAPGASPPPDLAQVAQHLRVCAECAEEFETLLEAFPPAAREGGGE